LSNAKDALVDSSVYNKVISIRYYQRNDNIIIDIKDNAGGIEEYIGDKIFDSYFTTKKDKGTGIGLYMSKEIIDKHFGGKISYENVVDRDGKGANFRIIFQSQLA
jgi:signal transduction histidine kinase